MLNLQPKTDPVPQTQPELPPAVGNPFPPSAELGELLSDLATRQQAIDQQKAEELARLRAIQSQD